MGFFLCPKNCTFLCADFCRDSQNAVKPRKCNSTRMSQRLFLVCLEFVFTSSPTHRTVDTAKKKLDFNFLRLSNGYELAIKIMFHVIFSYFKIRHVLSI